ncbi:WD40/YVTN/BNR-like repeat-containing protein [Candidatus Uabimicrobium sp. HlEnr_7]|uniref:WD40/YVTN/BNR-like repeat-containing protein n=1 Tax=Candidatus Uabimicrobium helgolandensis TaxID=3095367 RepID=UPI003557F68A
MKTFITISVILVLSLNIFANNWQKISLPDDTISFAKEKEGFPAKKIWAGTKSGQLFSSLKGKNSWETVNVKMENGIDEIAIFNQMIILGSHHKSNNNSTLLLLSSDRGRSWSRIDQGITSDWPDFARGTVQSISIDASRIFIVLSDFRPQHPSSKCYRSDNGGTSWSLVHQTFDDHSINVVTTDQNGDVLLGTSKGVLRSKTGYGDWKNLNVGFSNVPQIRLLSNNNITGERFTGTSSGIFKSYQETPQFPKGSDWKSVSSHKSQRSIVGLHLIHNFSTSTAVMGTHERSGMGGTFFSDSHVFVTMDSHNPKWVEVALGSLAKKPLNNIITDGRHVIIATSEGVFKSTKSIFEFWHNP